MMRMILNRMFKLFSPLNAQNLYFLHILSSVYFHSEKLASVDGRNEHFYSSQKQQPTHSPLIRRLLINFH